MELRKQQQDIEDFLKQEQRSDSRQAALEAGRPRSAPVWRLVTSDLSVCLVSCRRDDTGFGEESSQPYTVEEPTVVSLPHRHQRF